MAGQRQIERSRRFDNASRESTVKRLQPFIGYLTNRENGPIILAHNSPELLVSAGLNRTGPGSVRAGIGINGNIR